LRFAFERDAQQARACGLRLGRRDCHFLPDKLVDQRGLAGVGCADHGDDAAVGGGGRRLVRALRIQPNFSMNSRAASVSASCLLPAVASTSPTLATLTLTVNRAA